MKLWVDDIREPIDSGEWIVVRSVRQAKIAIQTADLILFVVDAKDGITALDMEIAQILRHFKKSILVSFIIQLNIFIFLFLIL